MSDCEWVTKKLTALRLTSYGKPIERKQVLFGGQPMDIEEQVVVVVLNVVPYPERVETSRN